MWGPEPIRRGRTAARGAAVMLCVAAWGLTPPVAAQQAAPPPPAIPPGGASPTPEAMAFEVPYERTVQRAVPGVSRALSVDPAMVIATVPAPGTLELHALKFGKTFVHLWTPEGRITRAVLVVPPPIPPPVLPAHPQPRSAAELAEHLTVEYQNRFVSRQRGPRLGAVDQNTTTIFDHALASQMQTPYGRAAGRLAYQRINSLADVTTWSASLADGHIGPLEHFDIVGGDTGVSYTDLSVPGGTIRGVATRYYDLAPYSLDAFYGRRRLGFSSGLTPGLDASDDNFLTGVRLQDVVRPWTWSMAYATASGADRVEIQSSSAVEATSWYWFDDNFRVGTEVGRNNEDAIGVRLKSFYRRGSLTIDTAYRNLSQRYENVVGRAAGQGERGYVINSQWAPIERIRLREHVDLFQDNLFKNAAEPDQLNLDLDLGADVDLTRSTLWTTSYSRQRFLGRLFPTDALSVTSGLRQRFGDLPLVGRGSVFGDYQLRTARSVSAPESDFRSHTMRFGIGAPLGDYFSWQVSQQWSFLKETFTGQHSVPRETVAGLNYFQQLRWLPLSVRSGVYFSTSDDSGSSNSFVANEDRWAWDAGLRYDLSRDAHAFFDYRLTRTARPLLGREYEMEMATGVRYLFDTGLIWQPSATLSGIVFKDMNGDGQYQEGEPGLPRVTVRAGTVKAAVTDDGGRFYLGRVRGRQLALAVDLTTTPPGYVPTRPNSLDLDVANPPPRPILFGFVAQSELRLRVFIDAQSNGRYDAMDVPLAGIRLLLEDGSAAVTDRSGWAFFRGVRPDVYQVTLAVDDLAAGYLPAGTPTQDVAVAEGRAVLVDFPVTAQRAIAGRVYVDRNRNGKFDGSETGVAGLRMCLDGVVRATTREDGRYLFKEVGAGLHRVRLHCGRPVAGFLPLSVTEQALDVPPQAVERSDVDFRLIDQESMMQDIVADVLRARQDRERLVEEMIELRKAQRGAEGGAAPEAAPSAP